MPRDELIELLTLLLSRGVGRRALRRSIAAGWGNRSASLDASELLREGNGVALPSKVEVGAALTAIERFELSVIRMVDPDYPGLLATIPDPPIALFVRGTASALAGTMSVAIVGSRRASMAGCQFARALAADLGRAGFVVISGMAVGVDGAAHRGALETGAVTVAVVGGGHEYIYPARHRTLASDIVSGGGAVVSEYPPTTRPRRAHFPERNRIISGLCAGVVVVEATVRSGSLITARMALEQGREVMAVPGPVQDGTHGGCHRLIRDGAGLVEGAADVLQAFGLPMPSMGRWNEPPDGLPAQVFAAMNHSITTLQDLSERTKIPIQDLLGALVALELDGFVESCRDGYIRRPRSTGDSA